MTRFLLEYSIIKYSRLGTVLYEDKVSSWGYTSKDCAELLERLFPEG